MKLEAIPEYAIHDRKTIMGFFGPFRFLSNFYQSPVYFENILYPSSENAYQAAKKLDIELRKKFVDISLSESKKLGRSINIRPDWESIKYDIMYIIVFDKFYRNHKLRRKLLLTGDAYLEETNHWKDTCWGKTEEGVGRNSLGKILMIIREGFAKLNYEVKTD